MTRQPRVSMARGSKGRYGLAKAKGKQGIARMVNQGKPKDSYQARAKQGNQGQGEREV